MPQYFSTFIEENKELIETIEIDSPSLSTSDHTFVLVKEAITFKSILCLKLVSDYSLPFRETQIIDNKVLIGWGDLFAIYDLNTKKETVIALDGYFGKFRIHKNSIFICSAYNITCMSFEGEVKWKSEGIAIDGIIINSFQDGIIYCSCQDDPPEGWSSNKLDMLNGRVIKNFS